MTELRDLLFLSVMWWGGLSILIAYVAALKNDNPLLWWLIGLVYGPLALIGAAGLPDRTPRNRSAP